MEAAFDCEEVLTVLGRTEDFAVFTKPVKERDFAAKCEELGSAVESRIRLY